MGDDTYITVHRQDNTSKDWIFHGKLAPNEATEEELARVFGGGVYRCQEKIRDESGVWRIGRTRTVRLTGQYRPPTGILPGAQKSEAAPSSPGTAVVPAGGGQPVDIMGAGILQLFQAAQAQQTMMTQMFQQMSQHQSVLMQSVLKDGPKGPDLADIIKSLVPLLTAYLSQPKQERDPLEMLKAVGEIVRANTGKQSDIADTIAAMNELMEMRDRLGGGGEESDPLWSSVPKLVEVIAEQAQASRQPRRPRSPAALTGPDMKATPITPKEGTPVTPLRPDQTQRLVVPLWARVIKGEGPKLLLAAKQGRTPGLVAEVAWEWAPDAIKEAMTEFFGRDDVRDRLMELVPGLKEHEEWADEFISEAQELIFGEEEDTGQPDLIDETLQGGPDADQPQG